MQSNTDPGDGRGWVEALRQQLRRETGAPVDLIETHISRLLLTDRFAFKFRKPVCLPFVDFRSIEARRHDCDEELRLNRRLAPSLYLDVVPVCGPAFAPRIGCSGPVIDYAVRMKRFAPGALLGERLAAGTLQATQIEALADRIAAFHAAAEVIPGGVDPDVPIDPAAASVRPVSKVLDQLDAAVGVRRIAPLRAWVQSRATALAATFVARARDGRVRDCHGDLHLDNAVVLEDDVTAFDCLEFDPSLRRIDVIGDVGFLSMDLKARGRPDLAHRFIDAWLARSGDYDGVAVLRFHEVYRALVRALVAQLRGDRATTRGPDYLGCAERLSAPDSLVPRLLITHGLSGSGKSTLARSLVDLTGAIRIRSDVERKRLFGLDPLASSASAAVDLYAPAATRQTFMRLADCARTALAAGYPVIVDAVFLLRAERDRFAALAAGAGVPFTILECHAPADCLRARITARASAATDPSEATLDVLDRQLERVEVPDAAEQSAVLSVDTAARVDAAGVAARWLAFT